jgi:gas vesicle protein
MNRIGKKIFTFSVGAAAGALAGLLLAPSSGQKTRRNIKNKVSSISVQKQEHGKTTGMVDLSDEPFGERGIEDYIYHS